MSALDQESSKIKTALLEKDYVEIINGRGEVN